MTYAQFIMSEPEQDRPQVVQWFEILSVFVVAFDVAFVHLSWLDLLWDPLILWAVLSVTRRKSNLARWLFSAFYGAGFLIIITLFAIGQMRLWDFEWTGWVLSVANVVQIALLWSPATSKWVASKGRNASYVETFS
jgi:hypothetical protein